MEHCPLVSIIIPCFNNQEYITEAIESALAQTHPNVEVIVVDDGSTDDSLQHIQKFADRIKIITQVNSGACVARNVGFEASSGDWIKYLDGDDILFNECIEQQVTHAGGREVVPFGDYKALGNFRPGYVARHYTAAEGVRAGASIGLNAFFDVSIFTSTTLYPRTVIKKHGGFDPTVRRGQEQEFNVRLYLHGVEFEYHPGLIYYYRQHDTPGRISNARRIESFLFDINRLEKWVELASTGPRSGQFSVNRPLLAKAAWRIGRRLLRAGKAEQAAIFFQEAKRLDGDEAIYGTKIYRLIAQTLGPALAEKVAIGATRLRGGIVEYQ